MTKNIQILVNFLLTGVFYAQSQNYSRDWLQKEFPGFGTDYIIFPGEGDQQIIGYFRSNNLTRVSLNFLSNFENVGKSVTYTLYTRYFPDGVNITASNVGVFDAKKETKFITHGWLSSGLKDVCVEIKNRYLQIFDINVIIMDWSPLAGNIFYPIAARATRLVGEEYSKFINFLIRAMGLNPKNIHLIGHSLGAHVSGFAGRLLLVAPRRITGLDPALPNFENELDDHLNYRDADFVDIIHTCGGFLGIKSPIGHADFYPNEGVPPQPGCGLLQLIEGCSHQRSWKLFAHSIVLSIPFLGVQCRSLDHMYGQNCFGEVHPMGEPTPQHARGIYYVKTTDSEPYVDVRSYQQGYEEFHRELAQVNEQSHVQEQRHSYGQPYVQPYGEPYVPPYGQPDGQRYVEPYRQPYVQPYREPNVQPYRHRYAKPYGQPYVQGQPYKEPYKDFYGQPYGQPNVPHNGYGLRSKFKELKNKNTT